VTPPPENTPPHVLEKKRQAHLESREKVCSRRDTKAREKKTFDCYTSPSWNQKDPGRKSQYHYPHATTAEGYDQI